ncbi:hypothetical protein KUTeg_010285 [Tegillarca granosa]|uniref:Ankyrin repeat domain-containing protein n=1 Tax=Tegillarca granosa TaxID=220873 RepID=A0ABQ9FAQ4_TEGGR|nr:hypothetical protein KUTeg_010285 [Tegillarca granosa]
MTSKSLQEEFPLHWLVWHNKYRELDRELAKDVHNKELFDPRGRTPLHLAVALGHFESTKVLLRYGASATAEDRGYWSGDPELVQLVLKHRDYQRYSKRTVGVPELLQKLKDSPDFYVEMKWEFTSWVPLVSRMCPSDTYRVWKSGSSVRIDTTLLGFDNMNWQRGSRSYIFKGTADSATVMEVDHDRQEVFSEVMQIIPQNFDISVMEPSEEAVAARLTAPVVTTYVDTDKISFERNKSGIWGWRSDRSETVNGYESKVFGASNVELITKTRTEHLCEQDKQKSRKNSKTPLESFLGVAEEQNKKQGASNGDISSLSYNPTSITPEEYFNSRIELGSRDIGRPVELTTKTQKFKATLWLCEHYPLSLQEQVVPIIDLMAASNAHFKKLRDFITLQLPAGFPIKIEIPLFHVLNARITFGNIFATEQPMNGVISVVDGETMSCSVDDSCFDPPPGYGRLAIADSLKGNNSNGYNSNTTSPTETNQPRPLPVMSAEEEQLQLALEISQRQQEEDERRRQEEDKELEMILKLSLTEK